MTTLFQNMKPFIPTKYFPILRGWEGRREREREWLYILVSIGWTKQVNTKLHTHTANLSEFEATQERKDSKRTIEQVLITYNTTNKSGNRAQVKAE